MKKANKALAALLALTMVTGSLAGCGSSNGSGKTETAPATEGTTGSRCWCICKQRDTLVASSAHFEENSLRSLQPAQKISISLI
ncbi:MAG: hypothetical protein ACLURV_01180 [Gallintestinimicrobium sp.]